MLWFFLSFQLYAKELQCSEKAEMGTPFKICVFADPLQKMEVTYDIEKAFNKIAKINSWMSDWVEGTELNTINANAGIKPVKINTELMNVLLFSQQVSQKSLGAYDPTFNVFWGLYNFKNGQEKIPSQSEIKERLPLINYKNLSLDKDNQTAFLKQKGMKLGLGAIGQGYAVDEVVKDLKKYSAGYVDGSGDTFFWGKKPNNSLWVTGIRNPRDANKIIGRIYGTDMAITTAGDDEKFFIKDGKRYHHIIDPKTGLPSSNSQQVTVIGQSAMKSDVWDTACFVLGPKKCLALIEKEDLNAIIVDDKNKVHVSKGLKLKNDQWGEYWAVE